jgi:hypothetical protein
MTIQQMVDGLVADFERDRAATRYFWWETYDRALTESHSSMTAHRTLAHTVLNGRRQQLEHFPDDPYAREELHALKTAINRLRCD